ncbi:IS66 family transposase [Desulfonatronum thioautotrophicum]|uniref:IS66 family transposase n=1 Tax=Desulfonatronum thioautotrophicum TaxID=617001 RepID=UPI001FC93FDB|nr:transposase [Desulfonatronum thioautotrophicum]
MRQEHTRPIMDKIKAILDERVMTTPPKSLLGKAITYALGQWSRVMVFLEDGRLRPDNNLAENAIRPFAVGRKNWLFAGSPAGAHASAIIYSLIETAKANGLNPYLYLLHVFTSLPQAKTNTEIRQLLPQNLTPQKIEELTVGNPASS